MRRPAAVLFDLDGTLVDSIPLILGAMRHAFRGRARAPTDAEWVATLGRPLRSQLGDWVESEAEVDALAGAYREFQLAHHDALMRPYDGVVAAVHALRAAGHGLAIVTSKGEVMARRALAWAGIEGHFSLVVGLEATVRHKPNPDPVVFACERLGQPASEAWFVGDSPFDMQAGNAAGARTCAALWGPFSREQLTPARPTAWAARMSEIPAIVRG